MTASKSVPQFQFARRFGQIMLLATACLGLGLGTPILAQAQTPPPNPGSEQPMRGRGREDLLQQLNLTPEQTRQIAEIRQRSKGKMQQTRQNLRQARQELNQMIGSQQASDRDIQEKFRQVQNLQQEMANQRMENLIAIRRVLTPEQRQQYATLMQQRRQQRGPRRPHMQNRQFQNPNAQEMRSF
jgi:periplasmic protein CpxP/Spy